MSSRSSIQTTQSVRTGYGMVLFCTLVWAGLVFVLTLVTIGPPQSSRVMIAFISDLVFASLLGGLVTWAVAQRRQDRWPLWQLILLALPFYLLFRIVTAS